MAITFPGLKEVNAALENGGQALAKAALQGQLAQDPNLVSSAASVSAAQIASQNIKTETVGRE